MKKHLFIALTIAILLGLPWWGDSYVMRLGTLLSMYAVLALSWNIVGGLIGYPSFAVAAFFGLGAYTGALLMGHGWHPLAAVACAGMAAFGLALALGMVLLRLKGHYFAIASLSLAEVLREIATTSTELTGGGMGLNVPPLGAQWTVSTIATVVLYLYALLLVLAYAAFVWIQNSRLGFALLCIKQNETAAQALGLNTAWTKSLAFGLSSVLVGVAGALYAPWVGYIEPGDVFDLLLSLKPIVMALIGGIGSAAGAIAGTAAYLAFEETVWRHFARFHSGGLGIIIVALILFFPRGLASWKFRAWGKRHG